MNWTYIFGAITVIGAAWALADLGKAWPKEHDSGRVGNVEFAHMALLFGICGLVGNFTNFAAAMLAAIVITGLVPLVLLKARRSAGSGSRPAILHTLYWGFFPIILAVFLLRSFAFEPYKIPSGSMLPTLFVGDFILVNKYTYGIRLPVINKKIVEVNQPQRGDVMVFRWPVDPSVDYIKRVVGVPGDEIAYVNKRLTINGKELPVQPDGDFLDKDKALSIPRYKEKLDTVEHNILIDKDAPAFISRTAYWSSGYMLRINTLAALFPSMICLSVSIPFFSGIEISSSTTSSFSVRSFLSASTPLAASAPT